MQKRRARTEDAGRKRTATLKAAQKKVRCYNCWDRGEPYENKLSEIQECSYVKNRTSLYIHNMGLYRCGIVEGRYTDDILLDTVCSRIMVRRNLVPPILPGDAGTIQS